MLFVLATSNIRSFMVHVALDIIIIIIYMYIDFETLLVKLAHNYVNISRNL